MSIKSLLMPAISQRLLSSERLQALRAKAERRRLASGSRHKVHYFHQTDDPYSALAANCLGELLRRYDIDLAPHVVGPPPDSAAPARQQLIAYSRKDAQLLGAHFGMRFVDRGNQPSAGAVNRANAQLIAAITAANFPDIAPQVSTELWAETAIEIATDESAASGSESETGDSVVLAHLAESNALREQLGHYLGAMFYYAGEWYWGLDRLYHLEQRLQELGCQRPGVSGFMFAPDADLKQARPLSRPAAIDFFFSFRSPYSAIVAPRVFELGRLTGAEIRLRYVLPMVMRGLPVPRAKRSYISLDTAREARARGVAFGRVNDPVGRPTERGLALLAWAEREGKGQQFVLSFMQGVWAEGIDAGSDRGLRRMVERIGLDWRVAKAALDDQSWRPTAEHNRAEMFSLGLWGVPSFRVGDTAVWGQDRLWAIQQALAV